jgi:hypothetical protein
LGKFGIMENGGKRFVTVTSGEEKMHFVDKMLDPLGPRN